MAKPVWKERRLWRNYNINFPDKGIDVDYITNSENGKKTFKELGEAVLGDSCIPGGGGIYKETLSQKNWGAILMLRVRTSLRGFDDKLFRY